MPFQTELTVRFRDVDRVGIAFFACAFDYAHVAYEELLSAAFGDIEQAITGGDFGTPLVHAEADFKRPMRFGERLRVHVVIERRSQRSITFGYRVEGCTDGVLRCTVQLVHAFIDPKSFKATIGPEIYLDGLRNAGLEVPAADLAKG